MALSFVLS